MGEKEFVGSIERTYIKGAGDTTTERFLHLAALRCRSKVQCIAKPLPIEKRETKEKSPLLSAQP